MIIRVLGSAAGGGFPQWNCGCPNCRGARVGTIEARARTQECVAVSGDGRRWYLLNCSPEIRAQIEGFAPLWPREPRHSPIAGILFTNGDLDHTLGLLSLRESHPLHVFATESVRRGFTDGNVLYRTLERFPGQLTWHALELDRELELDENLTVRAIAAPGKVPLHLERSSAPSPADNIGLVLGSRGRTLAYFSALAALTPPVSAALQAADCVFVDGTFWSDDELIRLGLGTRRAADMAHLPVAESVSALEGLTARRIFIHINNTNPILREDSPERAAVAAAGWEVAEDGMEVEL